MCVFDGIYYKITTTNYISKTSLYTTYHPSGPWQLKILMFALLVTHEIATYSWPWEETETANICWVCYYIDIKILGVPPPPPGAGHAFLRQRHMLRGVYLFLPGFSSLYDAIHGWMTGRMDGWMKSFTKNDHDVL